METLTINNKPSFLLALREGMGFAYACELSGNHPREASEVLKKDSVFYQDCSKAILGAGIDLLKMASDFNQANDHANALKAREQAKRVKSLVLWRSAIGEGEELSPRKIAEALLMLGDGKDVAVALGMEYFDYLQEVMENPTIMSVVKEFKDAV